MVIQAFNELNFFTSIRMKNMLILFADFNDGFQTIGCKCWRENQNFLHALAGTIFHDFIGKWFQPFLIQPGLETYRIFFGWNI